MKSLSIVLVTLVISCKCFAQDIITRDIFYHYQNDVKTRMEVQEIITDSGDELARYYLSLSKRKRTSGPILIVPGAVWAILVAGSWIKNNTVYETGAALFFMGIPVGLMVTGILIYDSGNKQFKKAIERFNSIQHSNLKVGVTKNGLGLTFNF